MVQENVQTSNVLERRVKMQFRVDAMRRANKFRNFIKKIDSFIKLYGNDLQLYNNNYTMECSRNSSQASEEATEHHTRDYIEEDYIGLYALSFIIRRQAANAERHRNSDKTERLYLEAIELGNVYAMNNLAIFYEQNYYPVDCIESMYFKAIAAHDGDSDPIYNLADFYKNRCEYKKMVKYLKMAIAVDGDIECMFILALYYDKKNQKHSANKYYRMAFKNEEIETPYEDIKFDFKPLFNELLLIIAYANKRNIGMNNRIFKYIHGLYINSEKIVIYNTKLALFTRLNNRMDCGICLEEKINIDLKCGHCVCGECYLRLLDAPCPYCRVK